MGENTFTKYTNYTVKELESYVADPNACVKKLEWNDMLSVLPKYLGDIREGVRACLSQKIGTYDRKVDGIILAYKNTKILSPLSAIHPNSVRVYVKTRADFYVFRPQSGSIIGGTVRYVSSNYLSAVIYRVFNVTIKLQTQKIQNIARGKEINFVIKSYDMKSDLPSIEGELIPEKVTNKPQLNGNVKSEARQNGGTARIKSSIGSDDSDGSEPEAQTAAEERDIKPASSPVKASQEQKRKKVKQEPVLTEPIEEESIADEMDNSIRTLLSTYEDQLNDSTETNGTNGTIKQEAVDAHSSSKKKKKKKKKRKSQQIDALEAELLEKFAAQCDEPDATPTNGHTNGETSEEPVTPKVEKPRKRKKKHSSSEADEFEASIMSSLLKIASEKSVVDDATPVRKAVKKSRKSVRFDDTIMEASFNTFDASEQLEISQLPAPNLSSTLK